MPAAGQDPWVGGVSGVSAVGGGARGVAMSSGGVTCPALLDLLLRMLAANFIRVRPSSMVWGFRSEEDNTKSNYFYIIIFTLLPIYIINQVLTNVRG